MLFFCLFKEGTSSFYSFPLGFFLVSNPPQKVIQISSSFLYFLLQLFLQSGKTSSYCKLYQANFFLWSYSSISSSFIYYPQFIFYSQAYDILFQFFFFREAASESQGSSHERLTLLWPRARLIKFLTYPPTGIYLHSSFKLLESNYISSGMNLRSNCIFEFSNWLPSHYLQISSAVCLESHQMTAQKYLRRYFQYLLSLASSKPLVSAYQRSLSKSFHDFLHSAFFSYCYSYYIGIFFHIPTGPCFSSSSNFSFPMFDIQTLMLLINPAFCLKELNKIIRSLAVMFIQSQLQRANLFVA